MAATGVSTPSLDWYFAERAFYSPITTGRPWGSGTVIVGMPIP